MRTKLFNAVLAAALISVPALSTGCNANIHDNTVNVDATLDFKTNVAVDHLKQGDTVAVTMNATGVVLVDPDTQPPAAEAATAAYFKIYLDDTDSDPLLVTAQASAQVKIPADASEGDHKLICRLHKHDGTPTDKEQEISIHVSASASVTTGDAGK